MNYLRIVVAGLAAIVWALPGRLTSLAYTAPPGERQGIGNLALGSGSDWGGGSRHHLPTGAADAGSVAGHAARALAIGAALVSAIVLAG